jgi:putative ABC transport system ATP-binding protein
MLTGPTELSGPLIEITGLSKNYLGLRPLRIQRLTIDEGEHVAILGLDQAMAETFINLVTGATLPERGAVTIFGRTTASIDESAEWLTLVDRFGVVSERAVLLEALSVIQNLAMSFTLEIEPPAEDVRARAAMLAQEMRLPDRQWSRAVSELDAEARARLRAARALALDPKVLLLEHLGAGLPRDAATAIGSDIREAAARRGSALVALTADREFAAAVAGRVLVHEPVTGKLAPGTGRWLDRLFRG